MSPTRRLATSAADAKATVAALRSILEPYASRMTVTADSATGYSLDAATPGPTGKPQFFGGVRSGKAYVSFYLFPVYVFPELLDGMSPELRKRMQGKSCFNFTATDPKLTRELARLTKAGFDRFRRAGYA